MARLAKRVGGQREVGKMTPEQGEQGPPKPAPHPKPWARLMLKPRVSETSIDTPTGPLA